MAIMELGRTLSLVAGDLPGQHSRAAPQTYRDPMTSSTITAGAAVSAGAVAAGTTAEVAEAAIRGDPAVAAAAALS
jgi:hypothetical protein